MQAVLMSARAGITQPLRDQIRAMEPLLIQNMTAMHIQVYTPTASELATFESAAKTARDTYLSSKASSGEKAFYSQITAGLTKIRGH